MSYKIFYDKRVAKDIKKLRLTNAQKEKLKHKIIEVSQNPISKSEGGYGEALKGNLKGYLKFRFDSNYRVIYKIEVIDNVMKIIIIGLRKDSTVYEEMDKRI